MSAKLVHFNILVKTFSTRSHDFTFFIQATVWIKTLVMVCEWACLIVFMPWYTHVWFILCHVYKWCLLHGVYIHQSMFKLWEKYSFYLNIQIQFNKMCNRECPNSINKPLQINYIHPKKHNALHQYKPIRLYKIWCRLTVQYRLSILRDFKLVVNRARLSEEGHSFHFPHVCRVIRCILKGFLLNLWIANFLVLLRSVIEHFWAQRNRVRPVECSVCMQ